MGAVRYGHASGRRDAALLQPHHAAVACGDLRPWHLGHLEPVRAMKLGLAFLVVLTAAASSCGDSPAAPAASLNLAGNWTGTWTFVSGGATVTDTVTMTVSQSGTSAGGQWNASGG